MKKSLFCIILIICFCSFFSTLNAAEKLDQWAELQMNPQNPVKFETSETSVKITANGSQGEQWGALAKNNETAIGIYGSVYLETVSGVAQSGFDKDVAITAKGNRIRAQVYFEKNANNNMTIFYRVRERAQDNSGNWVNLRQIASGALGNWIGDYAAGDTAIMAFALIGNEIWFYTPQNECIVKCLLTFDITPINEPFRIFSWTQNGNGNEIITTVKDVNFF